MVVSPRASTGIPPGSAFLLRGGGRAGLVEVALSVKEDDEALWAGGIVARRSPTFLGPPRRTRALVVALALISLGTCAAALPYMDFPPGDWYSPTVRNDTSMAVRITNCANDTCTHLDTLNHSDLLAGQSEHDMLANARGGTQFVVLDASTGASLGCLRPDSDPMGAVNSPRRLDVSQVQPCGHVRTPPGPRWVVWAFSSSVLSGAALAAVLAHRRSRIRSEKRLTQQS